MKLFYLTLMLLISYSTFAELQANSFTYQGELKQNGVGVNGTHNFDVKFFDAQTDGTLITNVSNLQTEVIDGIFSLSIDIGDLHFMGDAIWLQLELEGPPISEGINNIVFTPRQKIRNSPYAIHAKFVGINGVNALSIKNASITTDKIANSAVTSAKIADDAVNSDELANNAVGTSHIKVNAITSVQLANNSTNGDNIINESILSEDILNGTIVVADINRNSVQQRITGTCAVNSAIRAIANDGTVTCETDNIGTNAFWGLTGNSGTTSGANFIGTTDNKMLEFKVNNNTAMRLTPFIGGQVGEVNFVLGMNSAVLNTANGSNSILGGTANSIGSGSHNSIVNGNNGLINNGDFSTIIGGKTNIVSESYSVVAGGQNNIAAGYNSFVAGNGAKVRDQLASGDPNGDEHTFIWSQTSMTSSGANQVLFEAKGGFAIGTNAPLAPFHVVGQGTSFAPLNNQIVQVIQPKEITDNVALAINKRDATRESALVFSSNEVPEFDLRTVNGGAALEINNYDGMGGSEFMIRFNNSVINRVDINANTEPQTDNLFDFGSASFRWREIYTNKIDSTNAVNVTSDKRLKQDIQNINYGLSEVMAMRPVSYAMKNHPDKKMHLGLIAQEVENLIPEIVSQRDDEQLTRSMRYTEIIPVLIKATQEQQILIDQQRQQILALEKMLNSLLKNPIGQ